MHQDGIASRPAWDLFTLAYVGGILDGEGSIGLQGRKGHKGQQYATPVVQVTNTFQPLVYWLRDSYGGHVYWSGEKRIDRKPCWHWQVAGAKSRTLLHAVLPYLWLKREQALILLELHEKQRHMYLIRDPFDGRIKSYPPEYHQLTSAAVAKCRALNRRGVMPSDDPSVVSQM